MFNKSKILASLIVAALSFQNCSKPITPSQGVQLDGNTPQDQIKQDINQQLCLMEDDQDSDGDGICDKDEPECSQSTVCQNPPYSDEVANPSKSKWWIYAGAGFIAVAGTLTAKHFTGDWWWNQLLKKDPPTVDSRLYKIATKEDGKVGLESKEEWEASATNVHSHFTIKTGAKHGYNLKSLGGQNLKKGDRILLCIHSIFGHSTPITLSSGLAIQAELQLGGNYQTMKIPELLDEVAFDNFCKDTQGAFLGLVNSKKAAEHDPSVWVTPIPSKLLNSLQNEGEGLTNPVLKVRYEFDSLPTPITTSTIIKYRRTNPTNINLKSLDYDATIPQQTKVDVYNACGAADNACRANIFFANDPGQPATKTQINPAQAATREEEAAQELKAQRVACMALYNSPELCDFEL